MTSVGVKNIDGYNSKHKKHMPYIVVIVDEMSDLMLIAGKEIEKVNSYLRSQGKPDYIDEITVIKDNEASGGENIDGEKDELYLKAVDIIKAEGKASTSFLQRKLQIGYNRAARIMETMEKEGIVGQANHVGKREIL